jgi:hypothetical protein
MKNRLHQLVVLLMAVTIALAACGPSAGKATPTPTMSIGAIFTAAAGTIIAQLTEQAPSVTPTPIPSDTPAATATYALPLATATRPVPTAASCASLLFIDDITIPDGTQMPVGQEFTKTWRIQNNGTCPWTTSFKLVFSYGELMGGQTTPLPSTFQVGEKADVSVNLKVPDKTGKLTGVWTMVDDKGQHFGTLLTVVINVGPLTPTPTGSVTLTPTRTLTPNPSTSSTPTLTETPIPTESPSPTETPTETPTTSTVP